MSIITNPVFLRAAVVLLLSGSAFLLGLILIRKLRKSILEERSFSATPNPTLDTLPLHLYNTVIQQLKQQKHELQVQSVAEQQRARTSDNFSQAVLSNLSCGVLVFGANGLVKTSNPAAKSILGFASTTGMGVDDIFRGAVVNSGRSGAARGFVHPTNPELDEAVSVADEVRSVLHQGSKRRQVDAEYETPAGEKRFIEVTSSPVPSADGSLLGVACLINDLSELERIRRQQALHGEISAEMALQLRTSLTTISGYAQQLANSRDPELAMQIANDIAQEATNLDRSIGGFLNNKPEMQARSAANSGN